MSKPIEDSALEDVRESARLNDWCIVCGAAIYGMAATCHCPSRGYSNPAPVSVRAVLARLDADAKTIEALRWIEALR